jgi:hypothetical protein
MSAPRPILSGPPTTFDPIDLDGHIISMASTRGGGWRLTLEVQSADRHQVIALSDVFGKLLTFHIAKWEPPATYGGPFRRDSATG